MLEAAAPQGETLFDLQRDGQALLATGRSGIYRALAGGPFELAAPYPADETMYPARWAADGTVVAVGTESQALYIFSPTEERQKLLSKGGVAKGFRLSDVANDPAEEIVLVPGSHRKQLGVFSLSGEQLGDLGSDHYVTYFDAGDIDGDGRGEIVLYEYPVAKGEGAFRVMRLEGETVCRWQLPELSGWFDVLRWPGQDHPVLITNVGDTYLVTGMCGDVVTELEAPNASWFRYVTADWSEDGSWLAVAASGGGYRPYHMFSVFDRSGRAVHHEAGEGRAHTVIGSGEGFLLGVRNQVLLFTLSEELRVAGAG